MIIFILVAFLATVAMVYLALKGERDAEKSKPLAPEPKLELKQEIQERFELEKLKSLEQDNADMLKNIQALQAKIEEDSQEIEKQKALNAELSKKEQGASSAVKQEQEASAVIKREYEALKSQLAAKEEALNKSQETQSQSQGVSQTEYDTLKKKLEEAEQVLRMLHGAG